MSDVQIHPTAIVDPQAKLAAGVQIGPYSVIGEHVEIGPDTVIGAHVVIDGHTRLGARNKVFPWAVIGTEPKDLKYQGGATRVEIGDGNSIREFALIEAGTESGGWVTRIGNNCMVMANVHVGHDCDIADNVIMANNTLLAGHVRIESNAVLGGMCGVHQFVRIGQYSMVGGGSYIVMDVPPFCMVAGNRARTHGLNLVGLERQGFSERDVTQIKSAYKKIFRSKLTYQTARDDLLGSSNVNPQVQYLINFLDKSERGFTR